MNHPAGTDVIDRVNTLQFIDSMTGRLAWPIAAVILGLVFRAPIAELLHRLRKAVWGDKQAEFHDIAETASEVQQAMEDVAQSISEGRADQAAQQAHIEALTQVAANLGYRWAHRFPEVDNPPAIPIVWQDGKPVIDDRSDWRLRRLSEPVGVISQVSFTAPAPPKE